MRIDSVDIGRRASAAVIIYEALKKAIVDGQLADGAPLRQDEIARMFNTSRIPVREALTMLEQQGLVETQRFKGAVVAGISPAEASEIWEFRALLEGHVIERAVPNMDAEVIETARGYLIAFDKATQPSEWGDLNRRFHTHLYRASGLSYHLDVIEKTLDRVDRHLRAQLSLSNGVRRATEEHEAILDACAKCDAARAGALTRQHILGARSNLLDHLPGG
ncbi:HTH-type transcriptional repressor RspR [Defluviimonas aquaemixtae]|uniref:HTH-type transcriptional repressor RspR n=1 Tax=Albidovulum aquaemixtae TaxID=1542388 RepID=A0A2R8BJV5_9RHOB|nr:GntR family transcriptional regulator [Defluviimonas aquaemixtae]SPH23677.1 HTH-type transcriptional repressor RspR [Defluviimonas aquaemixtae]